MNDYIAFGFLIGILVSLIDGLVFYSCYYLFERALYFRSERLRRKKNSE